MAFGEYGDDGYGSGLYGGGFPPFGIESVTPVTPTLVRVRFTALINDTFPALLNSLNYSIFPALNVYSVILESAQSVLLITDAQDPVIYTLTISEAEGYFGQPLDPTLDQANFTGLTALPYFFAVATRNNRVRVVFSEPMQSNAALTDTAQYQVTDLSGNAISVASVEAEQSTDVRSTVLILNDNLVDEHMYRVSLLGGIISVADSAAPSPDTDILQWNENKLESQIPWERFSGEVQNGLYGIHGGLVFFSPALVTAAADSVIEVDSVDVCTKAYDVYSPPEPIDPPALYTYSPTAEYTSSTSLLNSTTVLWAEFPRLITARVEVSDLREDTVTPPVDGPADATLTEIWDPDYVSLLNNTNWKLFDNAGEPPVYFKTADNLAPIPAGSTTVINLQP